MYMRSILAAPRSTTNGSAYYPVMTVQRALRSLDDVFANAQEGAASMAVRVDVREDEKAFHVSADLPGLSEKEVEVTFEDGILTLKGEKKVEREEKSNTWHLAERSSGNFTRQLSLGDRVDAEAISATFEKGVLTVTLPKLAEEEPKTRKIQIKSA
jgi:HSP20 family protein